MFFERSNIGGIGESQHHDASHEYSKFSGLSGIDALRYGLESKVFHTKEGQTDQKLSFLDGFSIAGNSRRSSFNNESGPDREVLDLKKRDSGNQDGRRNISEAASPADRKTYLEDPINRKSADPDSLWKQDSRVLQIADFHEFASVKNWTSDHLSGLAKTGATAFAMEFVPKSMQKDLDKYSEIRRSGVDNSVLRADVFSKMALLQRTPLEALKPENVERESMLQKQFNLVDKAIDAGLRPLGIEPPFDSNQDLNPEFQNERNQSWSTAVGDYLRSEPNGKVVMFAGAAHFGYGKQHISIGDFDTTSETLAKQGFKPTILQFVGGDYRRKDSSDSEVHDSQSQYFRAHPELGVDPNAKSLPDLPDNAEFAATKWTDTLKEIPNASVHGEFSVSVDGFPRQADSIVFLME